MKWKKVPLTRAYQARVADVLCAVKWREGQWRATVGASHKPPLAVADHARLHAAKRFCITHPAIVRRAAQLARAARTARPSP